jgi:two-component system, NtrC family, nitrogen regulation sensor histidine kinase NtrY
MQRSTLSALGQWLRKLTIVSRRKGWLPKIELATFALLLVVVFASATILVRGGGGLQPLTPPLVALLLVANLMPAIGLIVLLGRRIAKLRAAQSPVGGNGRLHVRLVALFSMIASIPLLILVIFASLLFQYGVEFWYSDRARSMFENANTLAQTFYVEKQQRIVRETELMASDLSFNLSVAPIDSKAFNENFAYQVYVRELSEAAIVRIMPKGDTQSLALVNPYDRPTDNWVSTAVVNELKSTKRTVFQDKSGRMQAITPLPGLKDTFVYAARVSDQQALAQTQRFSLVLKNYNDLVKRSRSLQLQFHAALMLITLLIVGLAVWVALQVADRLVKPVGELVDAARRVTAGDLSTRVAPTKSRDEVGTLANAFNRMTGRLEAQRRELVEASDLIDRRRAFIEAVLSGVTAGVVAVGEDHRIRVINRSAMTLLGTDSAMGEALVDVSPDLDAMLQSKAREQIVDIVLGGEARTLAVKITQDELGHVLTFDDITSQLMDQRRAAWADVARRIAHEIKNPLTPIQLAADRLKRRFSKEIHTDPAMFERLTDTIIRQVNDLRRMVDEFSSFARMPKPVFHDEAMIDICRQAVFLHEVAHPEIAFDIAAPDPLLRMICDRRQLSQALTNMVKNGVEAIEAKCLLQSDHVGSICVYLGKSNAGCIMLSVTDNGIGLPLERDRLVEPYMTTRERGTGLGLAIVKKIVEEHGGSMNFADKSGGGTCVTLSFDQSFVCPVADENDATDTVEVTQKAPKRLTRVGNP